MNSMSRQRGHAVLMFALLLPLSWGLFTLAIDGSRAMQNKARLGDAVEVSALALASHNSEDVKANRELVTRYIDTYVVDKDSIERIDIERTECKASDQHECDGGTRYNEYALKVVTKHSPWLPAAEGTVGFSGSYDLGHSGLARKYQGDSIDISFVVDYSGSMNDTWKRKKKYIMMRGIVNDVLTELKSHQDTVLTPIRVSLVPYSVYTVKPTPPDPLAGLSSCSSEDLDSCQSQCSIAEQSCKNKCSPWPFGWTCREECSSAAKDCENDCEDEHGSGGGTLIRIVDELHYRNSSLSSIDTSKTVARLWDNNAENHGMICNSAYRGDDYPSDFKFKNVAFTDKFSDISNAMNGFRPNGGTASFQGIIKSAQYFKELQSPNPRQLMIILSDGEDNKKSTVKDLVNKGMCSKIKQELDGRITDNGRPVNFQMAFVGFDYRVSDNVALKDCVGEENIYDAADPDELLDIILNLISEEIGHLK